MSGCTSGSPNSNGRAGLQVSEREGVAQHQLAEGDGDGGFFPGAQVALGDRGAGYGGPQGVDREGGALSVSGLTFGISVGDAAVGLLQVPGRNESDGVDIVAVYKSKRLGDGLQGAASDGDVGIPTR